MRLFMNNLRWKLLQTYDQQWMSKVPQSTRYEIYRDIKYGRFTEKYPSVIERPFFRRLFGRFRMGVSEIFSYRLRYSSPSYTVCPCCMEEEKDDIHVLLQWPVYADLRTKFLHFCYEPPNMETFSRLMSSDDNSVIQEISLYLYYAFRRRDIAVKATA